MTGSFFMEYTFKVTAKGFYGRLNGEKIYSIDYFNEVEKLIDDAFRVLKTGPDATVTFQYFSLGTTDLLRIYNEYAGDGTKIVRWTRSYDWSRTTGTDVQEIKLTKKNIKAAVLEAIELFREREHYEQEAC